MRARVGRGGGLTEFIQIQAMCENGYVELFFLFPLPLLLLLSYLLSCSHSISYALCNLSTFKFPFLSRIKLTKLINITWPLIFAGSTVGNFTFKAYTVFFNGWRPLTRFHSEVTWNLWISQAPWTGISPPYSRCLHRRTQGDIRPCLECNSNPWSHCSSD